VEAVAIFLRERRWPFYLGSGGGGCVSFFTRGKSFRRRDIFSRPLEKPWALPRGKPAVNLPRGSFGAVVGDALSKAKLAEIAGTSSRAKLGLL
jgi:hypothetical protein